VLPSGYHVTSVGATGNATVTVVAGKTTNQDIGSTARNDLA